MRQKNSFAIATTCYWKQDVLVTISLNTIGKKTSSEKNFFSLFFCQNKFLSLIKPSGNILGCCNIVKSDLGRSFYNFHVRIFFFLLSRKEILNLLKRYLHTSKELEFVLETYVLNHAI